MLVSQFSVTRGSLENLGNLYLWHRKGLRLNSRELKQSAKNFIRAKLIRRFRSVNKSCIRYICNQAGSKLIFTFAGETARAESA